MSYTPAIPCIGCGRPVSSPSARPGARCERCTGAARFYEVRTAKERVPLDAAAVRARLAAGTLRGVDHVMEPAGAVAIAAHPDFRTLFLPGHPDALPLPAAPAAAKPATKRGGLRVLLFGGVLGLVAVVGLVALSQVPRSEVAVAPTASVAEVVPTTGAAAETPAPAPTVDVLVAMKERVGAVSEAPEALLAAARSAQAKGDDAVAAAERAAVAAPDDAEALALLAEVLADAGGAAAERDAALARAKVLAPSAPAVKRAEVLVVLARDGANAARPVADACLAALPGDFGCKEAQARVRAALQPHGSEAENLVFTLDELAKARPDVRSIPRTAAIVAATAELPGAEARLDAVARDTDPALDEARALLALKNGRSKTAENIVRKLQSPSTMLLVEAAGDAVGRGQGQDALALLAKVPAAEPSRTAALYEAQAKWILARTDPGKVKEAVDAAERLTAYDPSHPAVAQVRLAVATLAGDAAAASRAWDVFSPKGGTRADEARAWVTRAAFDLSQDHPREALLATDAALQADNADPSTWLWQARCYLAAQNGPMLTKAIRGAIAAVDGRDRRRRSYGGALPMPIDSEDLHAKVLATFGSDPALHNDLVLAGATIRWLAGDLAQAQTELVPLTEGSDADARGLQARLLLAQGRQAEALVAIDAALAARPKEPAWQLVRAEVLAGLGRTREADSALAVARSGGSPASSVALVQAMSARKAGNAAGVLVANRAAVEADPTDLVARRALRGVPED